MLQQHYCTGFAPKRKLVASIMFWYVEMNCNNASINRSFFTTLLLKFHICGAVIIAEGTGSEVNTRVDRPLALVVLALPRVCLLPS